MISQGPLKEGTMVLRKHCHGPRPLRTLPVVGLGKSTTPEAVTRVEEEEGAEKDATPAMQLCSRGGEEGVGVGKGTPPCSPGGGAAWARAASFCGVRKIHRVDE